MVAQSGCIGHALGCYPEQFAAQLDLGHHPVYRQTLHAQRKSRKCNKTRIDAESRSLVDEDMSNKCFAEAVYDRDYLDRT